MRNGTNLPKAKAGRNSRIESKIERKLIIKTYRQFCCAKHGASSPLTDK